MNGVLFRMSGPTGITALLKKIEADGENAVASETEKRESDEIKPEKKRIASIQDSISCALQDKHYS